MAEVDFDRFEAGAPMGVSPGMVARAVSLAAAAVSVALVLGLGAWGYRLAVRDVTGVPVVRAMEGPMRVAPEAPGGEIAAHLGLAVNEVAGGAAGAPADRLVLAPAPVDLTAEDQAGTIAALAAPVSGRAPGSIALDLPQVAPPAPVTQEDAIAAALAQALGQDAGAMARLSDSTTALSGSLEGTGAAAPVLRLGPGMPRGAVASAVRPRPRPGSPAAAMSPEPVARAATEPLAVPGAPALEIDPATLAPGMRLVQLGAFETADLARAEWDRVSGRFADLMAGKARVVQEAQSGGRAFWRLRAQGFDTEADARRFCAVLLAEQTACIPVTLR